MSIPVTELRPGITVELENQVFSVVEYNHIKMGRGGAIVRVKMKNIDNGNTIERTFKSNEKIEHAHVERKKMQYLYKQDDQYHFMDQETFEQVAIDKGLMGVIPNFIREQDVIEVISHNGKILGVEMNTSVALKVAETGSAFKGNSVSNVMKPATLETGVVVQVPMFINTGDSVIVDTRTGNYVERAKQ
ncbi:MAG: elongation factor P [Candidatus Margulisiibacteriota bacterium]